MVFRDLRDWLSKLEEEHDLVKITQEIQPEPEVGAIGRAICDTQGPAALLENVRGYKVPLAIGLHGAWRRSGMAMGLPKNATRNDQVELWTKAFSKYPLKSVVVSKGPTKENILTGNEINLFKFPLHRINFHDGSFYISKPNVVTKDPDSDWVNVGMYRMMVQDKDKTGMLATPSQHVGILFAKYEQKGLGMPMAVAIGTEPLLPMISGAKIPQGWTEFDYAGGIRGVPYELVKAETTDLPVPATAEIVLEGELLPKGVRTLEGAFGEFPGGYTGWYRTPIFQIKTITHRDDPIYEDLYIGKPNAENHYMTLMSKISMQQQAVKAICPMVTRMSYLRPYVHMTVISGKWTASSEPRRAIHANWGTPMGAGSKLTVVVDEDVDIWNPDEVLWAMATRVQPDQDIIIDADTEPSLNPAQMNGKMAKYGIDATKPKPPNFRFTPINWVEDPAGTEAWRQKLKAMAKEET